MGYMTESEKGQPKKKGKKKTTTKNTPDALYSENNESIVSLLETNPSKFHLGLLSITIISQKCCFPKI